MAKVFKRLAIIATSAAVGISLLWAAPLSSADSTSDLSITEVRQQLSDLETAQQDLAARKVASQEKLTAAQASLTSTQEQIAAQETRIGQLVTQVGQIALQQYQDHGMNTMTLFMANHSAEDLIGQITVVQQVTSTANTLLTDLQLNQATLADLERTEQATLDAIAAEQAEIAQLEIDNQAKVAKATALLNRMTAIAQASAGGNTGINAVGNGVANPNEVVKDPSPNMISPLANYSVTSEYSMRVHPIFGTYHFHDGLDMAISCGTPVVAPANGYVMDYYWAGGYGNRLVIDNGMIKGHHIVTSYNHLSSGSVTAGQSVTQGQAIAAVGSTGTSTGCHLHYMVWSDGELMNPADYV